MRNRRFGVGTVGRSCGALLLLALLSHSPSARAADRTSDEFLAGYVSSILERDLHWERASYALSVVGGVATREGKRPKGGSAGSTACER
jgi:hypothetical protein